MLLVVLACELLAFFVGEWSRLLLLLFRALLDCRRPIEKELVGFAVPLICCCCFRGGLQSCTVNIKVYLLVKVSVDVVYFNNKTCILEILSIHYL